MTQFNAIISFFVGLFQDLFGSFTVFGINLWWVIVGFTALGALLTLAFHNRK